MLVSFYEDPQPLLVNKRREAISSVLDTRVSIGARSYETTGFPLHKSHVDISFTARGETFVLELELYEALIHPNYQVLYSGLNGVEGTVYGLEHCYYKGKVSGYTNSWLAVHTCGGVLEGVVHIGPEGQEPAPGVESEEGRTFYLTSVRSKPEGSLEEVVKQVVYSSEDIATPKPVFQCGADHSDEKFTESMVRFIVFVFVFFLFLSQPDDPPLEG